MRPLALLALLALFLSGCTGEEPPGEEREAAADLDSDGVPDVTDDSDSDGQVDAVDPTPLPVPEPVVFSGSLRGVNVGLPANPPVDPRPECPLMEQQCVDHAVTVPAGAWNVTFTLKGVGGPATSNTPDLNTDYDLFVEGVGESTNPAGEDDVVKARLKAGAYTAHVLAWNDIDGEYTLTVTFAR